MSKTLIYGGPILAAQSLSRQNGLAVLVADEKIEAVGPERELISAYPEAQPFNLEGRTLLPGLVDAHRHMIGYTESEVTMDLITTGVIEGVRVAREALQCGITTVRDPGCKHEGIFTLRRLIETDFIPGPHVYAAGPNPTGTAAPSGWRNIWVNGPWEMRRAVRELQRNGAQWIKLVVSTQARQDKWSRTDKYLTFEEVQAGVDEAHQYGLRVSGHVEGLDAAEMVVEAGFDAIEHGTVIDERLAGRMAERGVYYVPTLFAFDTMSVQEIPLSPDEVEPFNRRAAGHKQSFRTALAAGVSIAVGTDQYRLPGLDSYVNELRMLTRFGMTNAQALQAATVNGAGLLGKADTFGAIAPGLRADLIAVQGNPLEDIDCLLNVDFVMKQGRLYHSWKSIPA